LTGLTRRDTVSLVTREYLQAAGESWRLFSFGGTKMA
jgi:hypothetical protein